MVRERCGRCGAAGTGVPVTARDLAEATGAELFGGKRVAVDRIEGNRVVRELDWRDRQWRCLCPAHDDRSSPGALYISEQPDRSFHFRCLAGCSAESILAGIHARGIDPAGPWPPLPKRDPRITRPRRSGES